MLPLLLGKFRTRLRHFPGHFEPSSSKRSNLKLHLATAAGQNAITAYGEGYVTINQTRHEKSIVVTPHRLYPEWNAYAFDTLTPEQIAELVPLASEIVLLGTGDKLRFPRPEILRPLMEARIGFEVMDVRAACRTYNILMAEGRKVAAALLLA